jgi:predicted DNA-binding transcriptional regulator AlpA
MSLFAGKNDPISNAERTERDHPSTSILPAGKGTWEPPALTSVMTSWKEIAQYLGKGVRTVQRWERELGFPVRRTRRGTKSSVLAVHGEIDAWVQSRQFPGGQVGSVESERTTLFRALKALRSENRKLRRQLALERAKK